MNITCQTEKRSIPMPNSYTITVNKTDFSYGCIPTTGLNRSDKIQFVLGPGRTAFNVTVQKSGAARSPFSPPTNPITYVAGKEYTVNANSGGDYTLTAETERSPILTAMTGSIKVNN